MQQPNYGYNCCAQQTNPCCNNNTFGGYGYALILVLFILLVIIGTARWQYKVIKANNVRFELFLIVYSFENL